MPWLQSSVNVHRRIFITPVDYEPLKKLLREAKRKGYKKVTYKRIVIEIKEVSRVLRELTDEKEWARTQKKAREMEGVL